MLMENLVRTGAGQFEPRLTSREVDNFPLANITHPDYDRHPLLRDAHVMTVEVGRDEPRGAERVPRDVRRGSRLSAPNLRALPPRPLPASSPPPGQVPAGSALFLPAYWFHQVTS
mmetsp:Transcript_20983/g.63071  ORF Transcript_20983/g.63071 Transcript_20983/m.63071 type:complete len:115 (+) Transcript_20983:954-1298(+)